MSEHLATPGEGGGSGVVAVDIATHPSFYRDPALVSNEHPAPMDVSAPIGNVKPLEMGEEEFKAWLGTCRRGLGGSSMPALLGVSRWHTPLDVWRGFFGVAPVVPLTGPMERGLKLEPLAAEFYQHRTGRRLEAYPGGYQRHPRWRWLVGHPDGVISPPAERTGRGVWECKIPNTEGYQDQLELGVEPEYVIQVNHYMNIMDLAWGQFTIFDPMGWTAHMPEFERDAPLIEQMEDAGHQFWTRHILTREPPEDAQAVFLRVAVPTVGQVATILRDPLHLKVLDQYVMAHKTAKLAEKALEAAKERMQTVMQQVESDFVVDRQGNKVYWRLEEREDVDLAKLREHYPEVAAFCTRPSERRPLKVFYPKVPPPHVPRNGGRR